MIWRNRTAAVGRRRYERHASMGTRGTGRRRAFRHAVLEDQSRRSSAWRYENFSPQCASGTRGAQPITIIPYGLRQATG